MKKSKFTEEQIAFALRQAEIATRVEEICRKFGISQATFYNWKRKYAGLGVSELRRLKQLEDENARLKRLVADLSLDKEMGFYPDFSDTSGKVDNDLGGVPWGSAGSSARSSSAKPLR